MSIAQPLPSNHGSNDRCISIDPERKRVSRAWGHVEPMVRDRSARKTFMRSGFTLIELLVVIAIIAILSVVVILTLNPASLLQQSRDSNRVSDMSTLNSAISVYLSAGGTNLGNSNTVYVSIPDSTATSTAGDQCQGLGLPTLPSTYAYHCAASSTLRSTDSTGWIPINFGSVAIGSSLSQLPVDPINQSSTRLYYTYTTNGTQYEVTSAMESAKYSLGGSGDVISPDGGTLTSVYEKGSKLGLEPLDYGDSSLVGFWSFNEGSGSVAYDYSGNNATGTWNGTATGTSGYYSPGKIGPWAGTFDGSTDYINISASDTFLNITGNITISAWIMTSVSSGTIIFGAYSPITPFTGYGFGLSTITNNGHFAYWSSIKGSWVQSNSAVNDGKWHYIAVAFDGTNANFYLDGFANGSFASKVPASNSIVRTIGSVSGGTINWFSGLIDDVRIYNRALSASEIAAMYAGGK